MTQHFNRSAERHKRKELRRGATSAEDKLWQHLRRSHLGVRFRRHYSVDAFVIDFYAPSVKLAVEVDGDSNFTDDAIAYDRKRTAHLEGFGIEVLRVTNADVATNIDGVLEAIDRAVKRRLATSP